ncbi:MAG: hypothetical protein ACM339_08615 [Ignavibacteria bacterium]|jgi:hypothetical protein
MPKFYVYILADKLRKLIIESSNKPVNLENKELVYYEVFEDSVEADSRKETIQSWPERKIQFLINLVNPAWVDWKEELLDSSEFSGCAENC